MRLATSAKIDVANVAAMPRTTASARGSGATMLSTPSASRSTSTSRPSAPSPSCVRATQGAPTERAASASSSTGAEPGRIHRVAAPSHGGGRTASPVSTSSTAPSTPTCTTAIWAPVSASEAAAARMAMSTRSRRSPASTDRKRRSAATISGFGSGTLARGSELRSRWRRLAASSASTPAESRAASPTPIGDGDVPAAASAAGVVGPPGGSSDGVVVVVELAAVLDGAGSSSGGTVAIRNQGRCRRGIGGMSGADAAGGDVTVAERRRRTNGGERELLADVDHVRVLDDGGVGIDDRLHVPGDRRVVVVDAGPGEVVVGQVPQRVVELDGDRRRGGVRRGGRRRGHSGGWQLERPADPDRARRDETGAVDLWPVAVELEDLPPAVAVTEVLAGQADERVARGDDDGSRGRRRPERGRHRLRRLHGVDVETGLRGARPQRRRAVGDRRCAPGRDRHDDEDRRYEALGEQTDTGRRTDRCRQLHVSGRRRHVLGAQFGDLGADLDDESPR